MGTTAGALAAHSGTSSQRVSAAACNDRHSRACTEIDHTESRTSQGHPKTTENSLSSHPESRVNCVSRFNRKVPERVLSSTNIGALSLPSEETTYWLPSTDTPSNVMITVRSGLTVIAFNFEGGV